MTKVNQAAAGPGPLEVIFKSRTSPVFKRHDFSLWAYYTVQINTSELPLIT